MNQSLIDTVLIVEGDSDKVVIRRVLEQLNVGSQILQRIEIETANSVTNIGTKLENLKLSPTKYKTYVIIADRDSHNTPKPDHFKDICGLLKQNNLPYPATEEMQWAEFNGIKTGLFIMPGNLEGHMLEDLLFASLPLQMQAVVKDFFTAFEALDPIHKNRYQFDQKTGKHKRHPSKSRIWAYKSTMKTKEENIDKIWFENHWDLSNPVFNDFKNFLQPILAQI